MSEDKKVNYCGHLTELNLDNQVECYKYIRDVIIHNLLNDEPGFLSNIKFFKITRNDKIKSVLENIQKHQEGNLICLFGYGPHLQKQLSIAELYKSKILSDKSTPFKQWNKLLAFDVVSQGRNELLDKRIKVPILLIFFTTNEEYFKSGIFTNEKYGFTEQC